MTGILTTHRDATWQLGQRLGALAEAGTFVALVGDLGAGKTVFAKGVGAGLGVTSVVSSPTFVLVALHESGRLPLWHVDGYRLEQADEIDGLGLEEADEGVVVMEWADRFASVLPADRLEITLHDVSGAPESRRITLDATGPRHAALVALLAEGDDG